MTTDYARIYRDQAEDYDALVSAEDHAGNLWPAIRAIRDTAGKAVLEVGVGTGRLTRVLARDAAAVYGCDLAPARLRVAVAHLRRETGDKVHLFVADARAVPVARESVDLALAGWVIGHFVDWFENEWKDHADRSIAEMRRALRPGGVIILIESLGTGTTASIPPTSAHADYYRWLQRDRGFTLCPIRTDYRFASVADALRLTRVFFGEGMAAKVSQRAVRDVPECTAVLWKVV
jgi:ubiquinone/menaquinone biosynthesis C-methylase UbiE